MFEMWHLGKFWAIVQLINTSNFLPKEAAQVFSDLKVALHLPWVCQMSWEASAPKDLSVLHTKFLWTQV